MFMRVGGGGGVGVGVDAFEIMLRVVSGVFGCLEADLELGELVMIGGCG